MHSEANPPPGLRTIASGEGLVPHVPQLSLHLDHIQTKTPTILALPHSRILPPRAESELVGTSALSHSALTSAARPSDPHDSLSELLDTRDFTTDHPFDPSFSSSHLSSEDLPFPVQIVQTPFVQRFEEKSAKPDTTQVHVSQTQQVPALLARRRKDLPLPRFASKRQARILSKELSRELSLVRQEAGTSLRRAEQFYQSKDGQNNMPSSMSPVTSTSNEKMVSTSGSKTTNSEQVPILNLLKERSKISAKNSALWSALRRPRRPAPFYVRV